MTNYKKNMHEITYLKHVIQNKQPGKLRDVQKLIKTKIWYVCDL